MHRPLQENPPNTTASLDGWPSHLCWGGCPVIDLTLVNECATGCHAAAVLSENPIHELRRPTGGIDLEELNIGKI